MTDDDIQYSKYKTECLEHHIPPLTKREWIMEGKLTFEQSYTLARKLHATRLH